MGQELAYSIHLGSDRNRSKVAKKVAKSNNSSTTSFSNNAVKNNKLISSENIDKLLNYTEEVKDTTKSIKGVNDLNITIDKVEKNYKNLENERDRLYYSNNEKDKTIAELKEEIEFKDKKINKLEAALEKAKTELYKFKNFWKRLIKRFQIKIFDERYEVAPEDKKVIQ